MTVLWSFENVFKFIQNFLALKTKLHRFARNKLFKYFYPTNILQTMQLNIKD